MSYSAGRYKWEVLRYLTKKELSRLTLTLICRPKAMSPSSFQLEQTSPRTVFRNSIVIEISPMKPSDDIFITAPLTSQIDCRSLSQPCYSNSLSHLAATLGDEYHTSAGAAHRALALVILQRAKIMDSKIPRGVGAMLWAKGGSMEGRQAS
ncbi:uncharacterized protein LY89DRAFT_689222 [Mollisia scopiformis]|uniref:Uncharacterized protein n=1 Tax=Mollisia scopiformis TaxID=149040 RepID=A0A194WUR2_MOLSC|nr:uncharacterized protein LY89DRAFT_689222 [Mollisia scopiformis]KUJ11352.1 hypothetical protein LY89DRAFT_689222 [Mollisia scopiformis]